ncbi:hypothetical protein T12_2451, partial [Trichinella patagoniensis]
LHNFEMGRFSPSQGTLKNSLYSIYFTTKRKWWKYRDEEMKHSVNVYLLHLFSAKFTHKLSNYDIDLLSNFRYPLALSKRASLTLKFWMLWNEVCLYQAQSITGVIGLDSF